MLVIDGRMVAINRIQPRFETVAGRNVKLSMFCVSIARKSQIVTAFHSTPETCSGVASDSEEYSASF